VPFTAQLLKLQFKPFWNKENESKSILSNSKNHSVKCHREKSCSEDILALQSGVALFTLKSAIRVAGDPLGGGLVHDFHSPLVGEVGPSRGREGRNEEE
jgi:hypothetical protein